MLSLINDFALKNPVSITFIRHLQSENVHVHYCFSCFLLRLTFTFNPVYDILYLDMLVL